MKSLIRSLLVLALLLPGRTVQSLENQVILTAEQAQHIGIRTLKPEPTHREPLVRAPARVSLPPHNEFVVSAPQPGFIGKVEVAMGSAVEQGQVLAILRSPELIGLQRNLLDAAAALDLGEAKLRRDRTLLAEGIIADIRYRETKSDHDRLAAALNEAEQLLAATGLGSREIGALKKSRRLSGELPVRSPITGVVLERMAIAGQRVDQLAPLFRVGKLDELWLEIDMPTERLGEIRVGDTVDIENPQLSARIAHVGQSVDPASQSAPIRAVIEGKTDLVKPGQHINVQLMHASSDQLFRLPASALVSQEGRDYVFVRAATGFEARPVTVASRDEYRVLIHEGLSADDEVVVQGVAALKASWVGIGSDE